jgi:DNA-binding transcriptional LysR family regulator
VMHRSGLQSRARDAEPGPGGVEAGDKWTVHAMVASGFGAALSHRLTVDERDRAVRVLEPWFAIRLTGPEQGASPG